MLFATMMDRERHLLVKRAEEYNYYLYWIKADPKMQKERKRVSRLLYSLPQSK
jgi:hypothetical protein